MKTWEAVARAIAAVEGDPEELIEVNDGRGLTRVPAWKLYRVRANAALDAARDAILERIYDRLDMDAWDEDGAAPALDDFKAAWDEAVAP